jgi:hypothetical protein
MTGRLPIETHREVISGAQERQRERVKEKGEPVD